ncbi:hypothetical protein E2K80_11620 [Rhodophyticola sp. CCM32]|uniref:hypothetical protein n=1 Tax=Rhodophyticola sp. CCM32 TaxID=2916397 RepID=UPI00107FB5E1|nr:hypothetical protein [Rhodophyticola sp. CCM32]QBY01295.1 hypothetical protein E2K80_11620 [Rhodophyticola sp. CCM32]
MQRQKPVMTPAILAAITFLIYVACIFGGIYQATLWSQVGYLWDHGWTIANWQSPLSDDPADQLRANSVRPAAHRLRYFLTYPLFWLGSQLGISADRLFTSLAPLLSATTIWSVARVIVVRSGRPLTCTSLLAILPLAGIYFAMDGRMMLAFCGFAILLCAHLAPLRTAPYWVALGSAAALFLTSVSSGTFYSAFTALVVLSFGTTIRAQTMLARLHGLIPLLFILLLYHSDLSSTLEKTLAYYGGGLSGLAGMVGHGFGAYFLNLEMTPIMLSALILGMVSCVTIACWLLRRGHETSLSLVLFTSIAMGVFGYSALSLALIPACTLAGIEITRRQPTKGAK